MGLKLSHCHPYLFLYRLNLLKYLVVPEPQYMKTSLLQSLSANLVILCLFDMLSAIYLNHQSAFQADEIEDVVAEWMLTAELESGYLTATQNAP